MAWGAGLRRNFIGETRGCSKCGEPIIVTPQMFKRTKYVCRPCERRRIKEYQKAHPEKRKVWARVAADRAPPGAILEKTRAYRRRNPEKYHAHQAVHRALKKGLIKREACAVCGSTKSHAHHDDYSRPLDVMWLCPSHHAQRHAILRTSTQERTDEGYP